MNPSDVVNAYIVGLGQHNLESIVSIYSADAIIEDPVGSTPIQGVEQITTFYEGALRAIKSATLTGPVRCAGAEAAFSFEIQMDYQGQMMAMDIIDVFRFDAQGKVSSMRAFWGNANMRQVTTK